MIESFVKFVMALAWMVITFVFLRLVIPIRIDQGFLPGVEPSIILGYLFWLAWSIIGAWPAFKIIES
jgi:hypothetical protein